MHVALSDAGIIHYLQHPILTTWGCFNVDIAVPIGRKFLVIECDGEKWHSSPKQKARDKWRQKLIEKNGHKVIRFTGEQILCSLDSCVTEIWGLVWSGEAR